MTKLPDLMVILKFNYPVDSTVPTYLKKKKFPKRAFDGATYVF
jgi:hypothetical protein